MKWWVTFVLVVFSQCGIAEVYRWVDSQGNAHYGDRAAVGQDDKAVKLDIKNAGAGTDPEAEEARRKLRSLEESRQREQTFAAQKNAERQQQSERLAKQCKALLDSIRYDQQTAVMFSYDNAGNRVVWTSEQRVAYKEKLQNLKQQNCPGAAE